jgi:hypothetical protein
MRILKLMVWAVKGEGVKMPEIANHVARVAVSGSRDMKTADVEQLMVLSVHLKANRQGWGRPDQRRLLKVAAGSRESFS